MSPWPGLESRGPPGSPAETLPGSASAAEAARETVLLVDLAIRRAHGNPFVGEEVKGALCAPLEEAKRQGLLIGEREDGVGPGAVRGGEGGSGFGQARGRNLEAVRDKLDWQEEPAREPGQGHAQNHG
jgi:hypothetical protein